MRLLTQTWLLASISAGAFALLEERFISFEANTAEFAQLSITDAPILVSQDDFVGVHIAANSLAKDLEDITGIARQVTNVTGLASISSSLPSTPVIIAGSLNSSLIRDLVSQKALDVSNLIGKWESFQTATIHLPGSTSQQTALVITGSDKRGTIFGIHTLASQSGQSPYHWFADVPAQHHPALFALNKTTHHGEPSVKYRGLFINDEEPALNSWWSRRHNATRYPLNTEFYSHVFDLLLRLKANYLWPAMWKSYTPPPGNIFFTDDPLNQQLANDYGIVISTAHHEPMQRATNEWNETLTGKWDWSKNKENITRFFEEGITRAGNNESYFTIGMRGLGDEAANTANAIPMLKEVFSVQRSIFKKHFGKEDAVNQVWALYKEVASYYDAGLNPPEDITLLFPDDNQGNVYRLPSGKEEVGRKGGTGVYFHFEYVGLPRSYKWHNSNNLPKVLKELGHAYERGARQIWIMNVGDIKPMELPLQLAMDLAWNGTGITFEGLPGYLVEYAAREFGGDQAEEIGEVLMEHSRLVGMRRYEHVTLGTYSTVHYREAERVLERWEELARRVGEIKGKLEEKYHAAFFQLVGHPVLSGARFHRVAIKTALNYRFALERRNSANLLAEEVRQTFEDAYDLVEEWDAMSDGKWADMMSQAVYDAVEEPKMWANPSRDILTNLSYVQLRQHMQFSLGNLGLYAEGSDSPVQQGRWSESVDASMPTTNFAPLLPQMDPYGPATRHIDVFHRGDHRVPLSWALDELPVPWLTITPAQGVVNATHPDQRLTISIDWAAVPAEFNATLSVGIRSTPARYSYFDQIKIPVLNFFPPPTLDGFPEAGGGYISVEGPHFTPVSTGLSSVSFQNISHLGTRSQSGSLAIRPFIPARENLDRTKSQKAIAPIYLFSDAPDLTVTVYINAGLDTDPKLKMEYSLTLDDQPANFTRVLGQYVENPHAGAIPPEWMDQVADQVWTKKVRLGPVGEGRHEIVWRVNSPEVYLEKIVVDTGKGALKPSYLGPPQTARVTATEAWKGRGRGKGKGRRFGKWSGKGKGYGQGRGSWSPLDQDEED
ncbi:hypothetical protein QBC35DRAFT_555211 [Podospora australis]|uniref:Gylcosyl hydrolase 115 C-terminal domain-containing protein n=1 Tax=Podospora australis TaxID=1536484 RepID=A0AAN7AG61_9PEZI|nr:hypothetical protein QBC35DRAFT_555211 [Podospora australis]